MITKYLIIQFMIFSLKLQKFGRILLLWYFAQFCNSKNVVVAKIVVWVLDNSMKWVRLLPTLPPGMVRIIVLLLRIMLLAVIIKHNQVPISIPFAFSRILNFTHLYLYTSLTPYFLIIIGTLLVFAPVVYNVIPAFEGV